MTWPPLFRCLAALLLLGVIASTPLAAEERLKVGVYNFKPLVSIDEKGQPQGLFIDLLDHIAQREGWKIEYVPGTWAESLARLEGGKIDLMTSIGYSEERAKRFDFTREPIFLDWGQIYKHRAAKIDSILNLNGKTVSCLESSIYTTAFLNLAEQFQIKVNLIRRKEYAEVLADVENGAAEAGLTANVNGLLLESNYAVDRTGIVFSPIRIMFAAPKGKQAQLIGVIDRYVEDWKANDNSFYKSKLDEWMNLGRARKLPEWLKSATAATALTIMGLILFSLTARRQVKRRTAELAASERKFRDDVEKTPDIITHVDKEGRYLFVNKAGLELFGRTAEATLGRPAFDDIHPDDKGPTMEAFKGWLASDVEMLEFENRLLAADGAPHTMLWNIRRIFDAQRNLIEFNSIAHDVTKQRDMESRLRESLEQLVNSNIELERFAYVASHDLREPIRTIVMFSQLLTRHLQENLSGEVKECLDFVITAAKRMDALVSDLLSYSRIASDSQPFSDVDLNAVLAEVRSDLKSVIETTGASIESGPLPNVPGIRLLLHQLFQNLISNAVKFRKPGQAPQIRITAQRDASGWQITFADNGIGIEPQYAEQIFIIFKRLHTAQAYPGTGVGLAICKRIMDRHNGRIWVESQGEGTGTSFHILLPETQLASSAG